MKRFFILILLGIEWLFFLRYSIQGPYGFREILQLQRSHCLLQQEITELQDRITMVEKEKQAWQQSDFFKQKYAREQLHMQKNQEEVFIFDE